MLVLAMQFSRTKWLTREAGRSRQLQKKLGSTAGFTLPREFALPHNGTEIRRCIASPDSREN
jgi:hypothetical protein